MNSFNNPLVNLSIGEEVVYRYNGGYDKIYLRQRFADRIDVVIHTDGEYTFSFEIVDNVAVNFHEDEGIRFDDIAYAFKKFLKTGFAKGLTTEQRDGIISLWNERITHQIKILQAEMIYHTPD